MNAVIKKSVTLFFCLFLALAAPLLAQEKGGSLRGLVTDPQGAVVGGATLTVTGSDGKAQTATSDKLGNYAVRGIAPGKAAVSAVAPGFTAYQNSEVAIVSGAPQLLNIALEIAVMQEQVTVQSEGLSVDVSPDSNATATVLKEKDLESLSDDPDELEQDLLALAGPSAGPNGGQIYIDGFSGGTLPPKSSIREVRINQNPFSAMYDRPGFGRVEVFTKPGTDSWHGQVQFGARNKVLNSRNPYLATDPPPYHTERYSGNVGGALSKKASLFVNIEQREIQELQVVNATTLDSSDNPFNFTQAYVAPEKRTNISPRLDLQISPANTLSARYQFFRNEELNQGFGTTTLVSRADNLHQLQHTLQLSDTQVLSAHVINETRFQYMHTVNDQIPNVTGLATVSVPGEFGAGTSLLGTAHDTTSSYELQSYTSWQKGKHLAKFGGRLRASTDTNYSDAGYTGELNYSDIYGPAAAAASQGGNCSATQAASTDPLVNLGCISALQAYFQGRPSQLAVVGGSPTASLSFADVGLYAEDDWKLRSNLTLSYGLRFESQTAIHDKADFAPRVGLSWGLGKSGSAPKTVVRVGYGIFFDRFGSDNVLLAQRMNGTTQQQVVYTSAAGSALACPQGSNNSSTGQPQSFLLGINSALIPTACTALPSGSSASSVYEINPKLHAPYTMQAAVSLEQQLGKIGTVSLTYLNSRGEHQLDTINANAPYLPTYDASKGIINEYNSEGIFRQNQLIVNTQIRVTQIISLSGFYQLGYANADVFGVGSNPSNSARLADDYGRAGFDIRNRLFLSGSASLTHNIRISPFIIANSGAPFNITTGADLNGDSFYNDRPSFSTQCNTTPLANNIVQTVYGCFDLNQSNGKPIPVNYGKGPSNISVNLRVSKTFGFGQDLKAAANASSPGQQGGPGSGGGARGPGGGGPPGGGFGGGPRGMGSIFGPSNTSRRYNLTVAGMARNLLNTWNPGNPVGNLSSSKFGQSNSMAGGPFSSGTANRIVELSATFAF